MQEEKTSSGSAKERGESSSRGREGGRPRKEGGTNGEKPTRVERGAGCGGCRWDRDGSPVGRASQW
jgi:hypothetical protein